MRKNAMTQNTREDILRQLYSTSIQRTSAIKVLGNLVETTLDLFVGSDLHKKYVGLAIQKAEEVLATIDKEIALRNTMLEIDPQAFEDNEEMMDGYAKIKSHINDSIAKLQELANRKQTQ